jgi:hypothetical protein
MQTCCNYPRGGNRELASAAQHGRLPAVKDHRFLKPAVDAWLESNYIFTKPHRWPASPIEIEAYLMCQQRDHAWMREERFHSHACTVTTGSKIKNDMTYISLSYKCRFCDFEETVPYPA